MSPNNLLAGMSGFGGSVLVARLKKSGHRVPRLRGASADGAFAPTWSLAAGPIHLEAAGLPDAVVHLAGQNLAQRCTPPAKARVRASRGDATRKLRQTLARSSQPPRVLACASATGFYGDRRTKF